MPTAKIDRFMLRVHNDLGNVPAVGESVEEVSASAATAVHHRLNPYFDRPRRTHTLRVAFKLAHNAPADVRYVSDSSVQPTKKEWKGTMIVPRHRLRSNGPQEAKQLGVKKAPAGRVSRQIDCEFWVDARRNYETQSWKSGPDGQEWENHPGDSEHSDSCVINYTLAP